MVNEASAQRTCEAGLAVVMGRRMYKAMQI
jgi:hypothetical protein